MSFAPDRAWRVRIDAEIEAPLSASATWGQMRGIREFLTHDPLHDAIDVDVDGPRPGAAVEIVHAFFGVRITRVGRVLRWREGDGFAISDLSKRGVDRGFPHVLIYDVRPAAPDRAILRYRVRGVWTMRLLPRWLVGIWLRLIVKRTTLAIRNHLVTVRIAQLKRAPTRDRESCSSAEPC